MLSNLGNFVLLLGIFLSFSIIYVSLQNIKSEGLIKGVVQVPADGNPIIMFSDHGILRFFWKSFFSLPGNMYRSNQPYPFQIQKYKKRYGIKSIINLRGERNCSSFAGSQ